MSAGLTLPTQKPNPTFLEQPLVADAGEGVRAERLALNQWIRNAGVVPQIAAFSQLQAAKYPGPDRVGRAGEKASRGR